MHFAIPGAIIGAFATSFVAGGWVGWVSNSSPSPPSPIAETAPTNTPFTPTSPPPTSSLPTPSITPSTSPQPYSGDVLAYGDSILILADTCLTTRGFSVDSQGSRRVKAGPADLQQYGAKIPDRVLIHLGTNGGATAADFEAIMEVLGTQRIVTFVTIQLPDDYSRYTFENRTNEVIRALPERYPNVRVFDWNAASETRPDWLYEDGYHPNLEGCDAYARLAENVVRSP
jgi:lysophospholipase L1-like esterase